TLWLSARFLINSPSPTFSIFLAFILCTPCILVFSLVSTLVYLVHHLIYLVLSILLNSTLFAYILPSVFRPRPSLSNSKSSAFAPLALLPHTSCVDLSRLNGAAVYHEPTSQYCVLFRLLPMHANAFFLPLSSHSLFHSFLKHQPIAHPHPYPHPHPHLYPHSAVFAFSLLQITNL